MDVIAKTKFARMSPSKARDLATRIKGLPVSDALSITEFSNRKAANLIGKTLKSAIANAEHNNDLDTEKLRVKSAVIDGGPKMSRYWARARGMVRKISKPMCHITIVLTDESGAPSRAEKKAAAKEASA
jgi:large subunit ribosomal protein L22